VLIVQNADLLWTGKREFPNATLSCQDSRVVEILTAGQTDQPRPPSRTTRLDASGCVVIPGLVNAHHHLLQSAFRTHPATRHISMRDWLKQMGHLYSQARVDPPFVAAAAAVAIAESLLNGVTTVADHHLTWPPNVSPTEIASAAIETARDMGIRFVFAHGTACGEPEEVASYLETLASRYKSESSDGMFQLAVGPAGIHSDNQAMFETMSAVASQLSLRRRTQANEQIDVELATEQYGKRPLELLDDWGWLAADVTLAHLCDITPQERQRIAQSGASATHAPGCDVPMGWGVAEVGELLDAGVAVGLGTSGGGSNDAGHLLADARLAMQISALTGRPLSAKEVLTMATAGSAAGLGRSSTLGHLEPSAAGGSPRTTGGIGAAGEPATNDAPGTASMPSTANSPGTAADFCCYDISGPDDAGVADRLAGLLWASPGRKPRHVVIAGKVVVQDWQLVNTDVQKLVNSLRNELQRRLG